MRPKTALTIAFLTCLLSAFAVPAEAVMIGQIDDFQDGTTQNWFVPDATHPNPPTNIATGGPGGAGDQFLQLTATGGGGPGSRMAVLNETQWAGNYTAAGVRAIEMDVNNFGPDDLFLRLLFEDFSGIPFTPPVNLALSANALFVPAGSGWVHLRFKVSPAFLAVETFGSVAGALADTDTLRIFHNPNPAFPGPGVGIPTVNAQLGVDNITAVPEPGAFLLLAAGLAAWSGRRRNRGAR
jgi:hypothetical protein